MNVFISGESEHYCVMSPILDSSSPDICSDIITTCESAVDVRVCKGLVKNFIFHAVKYVRGDVVMNQGRGIPGCGCPAVDVREFTHLGWGRKNIFTSIS